MNMSATVKPADPSKEAAHNTPVSLSLGNTQDGGHAKITRVGEMNFEGLSDLLNNFRAGALTAVEYAAADKPTKTSEKEGAWISPGRYSKNRRNRENWLESNCIVLDADGTNGKTGNEKEEGQQYTFDREQIKVRFKGLRYILVPTHSHTVAIPRWRLFIFLNERITDSKIFELVARHLALLLDGYVDPRSYMPEQYWFLPSCPKGEVENRIALIARSDGELFDWHKVGIGAAMPGSFDWLFGSKAPEHLLDLESNIPAEPPRIAEPYPFTPEHIAEFISAAQHVFPNGIIDWDSFYKIGMSLAELVARHRWPITEARKILDKICSKPEGADQSGNDAGWANFIKSTRKKVAAGKDNGAGGVRGYASLYAEARKLGWVNTENADLIETPPPWMKKLNARYAWIEANASIFRMEYGNFIEPAKFKVQHDNCTITVPSGKGTKSIGIGTAWITHGTRRQHKALVMRPAEGAVTKDNCLNEWRGFAVTPTPGNIKPFLSLLMLLVPARKERRFVLAWLSHLVQHPDIKMFVSLAFWSHAQGVGKNLLFDTLVTIIGATHATVIGQSDLTGDFNGWSNRRIFVIGDEVSGSNKRQETNKLKGLITGTTNWINEKNQPHREAPNLMNFVFLSNHHDALFMNDGDRRYFVWEILSGQLSQSAAKEFVAWRDRGGLPALLHFLQKLDIGGFNPKAPAPMTEAKQQMVEDNRSDLEGWVAELMASNILQVLGRELATATELGKRYENETEHKAPSTKAIVGACKRQGVYARPHQVRIANGKKVRVLALARMDYWKHEPEAAWATEMSKQFLLN